MWLKFSSNLTSEFFVENKIKNKQNEKAAKKINLFIYKNNNNIAKKRKENESKSKISSKN